MRSRLETEPATAADTGFGRAAPWPSAAAVRVRARARLASIDPLRGFVIVLMALDHVRDYFTAARFSPLDLAQTDPPSSSRGGSRTSARRSSCCWPV